MKRTLAILVLALTLTAGAANAQPLYGEWDGPKNTPSLAFHRDGTCRFGPHECKFQVNGGKVDFFFPGHGSDKGFSLSFKEGALRLQHPSGPVAFYSRKSAAGASLAREGPYSLTLPMAEVVAEVVEFLQGRLSNKDRKHLYNKLEATFHGQPRELLEEVGQLSILHPQILAAQGPQLSSQLRQTLLHAHHPALKGDDKRFLGKWIRPRINLHWSNPEETLVLTEQDLLAWEAYVSFLLGLVAGEPRPLDAEARKVLRREVDAVLPLLNKMQARWYCDMAHVWPFFRHAWLLADEATRARIAEAVLPEKTAAPGSHIKTSLKLLGKPQDGTPKPLTPDERKLLKSLTAKDHHEAMKVWESRATELDFLDVVPPEK